ncbi:MAG: polyprenyl synthetase family protein [Desulfotomaculaceae bacterium]|nr:polyprenyl synthetase family protein [Desulfotomaculaceae bacterium]MDD4766618.1 polyprenyl synthetase family protein [Desulfotomaculaceae bacterium]
MLELYIDIKDELQAVENELRKIVQAKYQILTETSTHLLNAGGKRLRPALALYGAKFYNFDMEKVIHLATTLELIHMASLVHDDVVDASMTRRGKPTVKAMWGNSISTHIGSFLFAKSAILISRYEDTPLIFEVLSDTSVQMAKGEIIQISSSFDINQSIKNYLYRIKCKTALLISASAQLGAVACGAGSDIHLPLRRYGYNIGMAFQITDDILDMIAEQRQLGKPIGGDLRQGIITLPIIYALKHCKDKKRLVELVTKVDKSDDEVNEALEIVKESGAIEYSFDIAQKYIMKAKMELKELPDIPTRLTLGMAADFMCARKF